MANLKITEEKLDKLADIIEVCLSFNKELAEIIDQALCNCPDLKERYKEVQQELEILTPRRFALIEEINKVVLDTKESIKGEKLHAIFSKGRVTWDGQKLVGFAIAHPEINELKKTGNPSVSIREVKEVQEK